MSWANKYDAMNPYPGSFGMMYDAINGMGLNTHSGLSYMMVNEPPINNFTNYMDNMNFAQSYPRTNDMPRLDLNTLSTVNDTSSLAETAVATIENPFESLSSLSISDNFMNSISRGVEMVKDVDAISDARSEYVNQMDYGHGIGFQQVAQNNLNAKTQGISTYNAITDVASATFAPLGILASAALSPSMFSGPEDDTFMAQDTAGNMINAQDPSVIDTISSPV